MSTGFLHVTGTVAALGFISAVTAAILFFMRLPIFDEVALSWVFVFGLLSAAISAASLIVRSIWDVRP